MREQVELLEKNKPRQERAKRTYEAILESARELLVEVGVERISTNLIAERAGITVPALYRYFPNKYAVLNALGAALMDRQNVVFDQWLEHHTADGDALTLIDNIYEVLKSTYEITRELTAGIEVVQALRAVAPLQEVRLVSHRIVSAELAEIIAETLGLPADEYVETIARLTVEMCYSMVETVLEDETLPTDLVLEEGARMIRCYWQGLLAQS
jgi:AcrR family transcriptional regulator